MYVLKLLKCVGKICTYLAVQCIQWMEDRDFNERKVREREVEGERKGCYKKIIQDPESEPKLLQKSDPDPKKIILDPQRSSVVCPSYFFLEFLFSSLGIFITPHVNVFSVFL
jgi:hypothetical protein